MKKVIVLLGPTGVGKTGASILLAKALETEIISADSMQIYKGMDIGTAKPSSAERSEVKHHMIDIIHPSEPYNTGIYIKTVIPIINELHKKGKIPLVVGGTGLYIKAMTRGIFSGPSSDRQLRDSLIEMEQEEEGSIYAQLLALDPEAAEKIGPHDARRIVRALEVCIKSSEKISTLQKNMTSPLPYEFIKIGLARERKELYSLINSRVDDMMAAGLIDEVRNILACNPDRTPLQAIGYKELALFLKNEIEIEEAVALIKRNSRRYAKRQFSWFNKEKEINWLDITGIHSSMDIFKTVMDSIRKNSSDILNASSESA